MFNYTALFPTALVLLIPFFACGDPADRPELVKDLRILAIKAEPPELLFDRGNGAATQSVVFDALVVDPRGQPTTFHWSFCPLETSGLCADFNDNRLRLTAAQQAALDLLRAINVGGDGTPDPLGKFSVDPLAVALPGLLLQAHVEKGAVGPGGGAWPAAILSLGRGSDALVATKRVAVNARDLSQWNDVTRATIGKDVCAADIPTPGCLAFTPRLANRNPVITGLRLARGRDALTPFSPLQEPVTVAPGEVVRIDPVLSSDSLEPYQELDATLKGHDVFAVQRIEEPVVSWFVTAGDLADPVTTASTTKTLDNRYTAPDVVPASGQISLWIVVRDQRGGTDWRQLSMRVAN